METVTGNRCRRPEIIVPWQSLADSCGFAAMRYAWDDSGSASRTSPRRRAEFRAGRRCAGEAMRLVTGRRLLPRRVKTERAPIWPEGMTGAISHCNGYAVAVAAHRDRQACLGIDIERLLDAEEARSIAPQVLSEGEWQAFGRAADAAFLTSLAFSAKESLFKALYPTVREFRDFHAAELVLQGGRSGPLLRLRADWSQRWPRGRMFDLKFRRGRRFVLTCVAIPPDPEPDGTEG